jgi:FAD/FMN-containing dehydrogenase
MGTASVTISGPVAAIVTTLLIIIAGMLRRKASKPVAGHQKASERISTRRAPKAAQQLIKRLSSAVPDDIILPTDVEAFGKSMNNYWAQQECEVVPACIVRPGTIDRLSTAITILKREYDERRMTIQNSDKSNTRGLFAIRSGGHSPVARSASIEDGVLIDMSHFSDVTPSEDGSSVTIGTGARWGKVYEVLKKMNLAVAGGRNSAVGVGGLILGGESNASSSTMMGTNPYLNVGGISFFSQRYGLVCSNILSYDIVLASGSITTASASTNPDLWQALKGGGNNFGIVTYITIRSFPATNIWSGFLYMPSGRAPKVLAAFHEFVSKANPHDPSTSYDAYASGPIACFTYLQNLGIQAIAVNLVYTKPPEHPRKWPDCWKHSSFRSIWRLWSTCKVRTLSSACDEMNALNPPGRRQVFGTTTIKNDPATIQAAYQAYRDTIATIKRARIDGMSWTLVLQPIVPDWVHKGDTNSLGLHDTMDGPLVLVSFTVNWIKREHDEVVGEITREAIDQIDAFAAANGTGHRYRYLNYCGSWQRPFEGYGEENVELLQDVSRKYDQDGLFQHGCVGGFKLNIVDVKA